MLVYFSDRPIAPSSLDATEYQRVVEFRRRFKDRGLYGTVSDIDQFRDEFRGHLARLMHEIIGERSEAAPMPPSPDESISIGLASGYWVVILASLENSMRHSLAEVERLRTLNVKVEDLPQPEVTAIVAPALIRAFIVDVLVKHGVMTPDAGATMGYRSLMDTVTQRTPEK